MSNDKNFESVKELVERIDPVLNKLFVTESLFYHPAIVYQALFFWVIKLSLLVKKEQPEFWQSFEAGWLNEMYLVLTSKDVDETLKILNEKLDK